MILIKTILELDKLRKKYRAGRQDIGFVPTMGALHAGHIALIAESRQSQPITLCSIFVNPAQFNNTADFEKYPITIERDIDMLEKAGCDVLFMPTITEMYPANDPVLHYDLGFIETVLEGAFRPGHFQGVCRIVDRLLSVIKPHSIYMGQKDYQQCKVVATMMALKSHKTELKICDTIRETDGLAMSSRNMRLNTTERKQAIHIIKSLRTIKNSLKPGAISQLEQEGFEYLEENGFKVDYVSIADAESLAPVNNWDGKQSLVALVAAFLNEVRLIDNLVLTIPQKV